MRSGFSITEFEKEVLGAFGFLLTEEGFECHRLDKTPYRYLVDFTRKGMLIQIDYSLKNDTLDVGIYRHPETIPVIPRNDDESTSLGILLTYANLPFAFYENMMPFKVGGIGPSLIKLAEVFRTYALEIIRGEEWISVTMVRRGERRE